MINTSLHSFLIIYMCRFESVEQRCVTKVLLSADVIVSTCIGAGVRTSSHILFYHMCTGCTMSKLSLHIVCFFCHYMHLLHLQLHPVYIFLERFLYIYISRSYFIRSFLPTSLPFLPPSLSLSPTFPPSSFYLTFSLPISPFAIHLLIS